MALTSTRSSSISSASTTSSKNSDTSIKKKFRCSFPNCGKSFFRSEHLNRHALNHKDGKNTCQRCSATRNVGISHLNAILIRVLDRHMARHKEKDEEAGGEGLGILATRKRIWRDSNGNIVNARKPSYIPTQDGTKRRQLSQSSSLKDSTASPSSSFSNQDYKVPQSKGKSTPLTPTVPMSRTGSAQSTIVVDTSTSGFTRKQEEDVDQTSVASTRHPGYECLPSHPHQCPKHNQPERA